MKFTQTSGIDPLAAELGQRRFIDQPFRLKPINKGDTFLCQQDIAQGNELLFKNDGFYRSKKDHSLVSENGSNYFGFNEDVLDAHFVKV